ncbi:MAG: hypothetical protein RIG62_08170 [Cyclobacteriaceae bacterium]
METIRKRIYYPLLMLLCFAFSLTLTACSEEDEPDEVPEGMGTFALECAGAARFETSGTMEAQLVHETNRTCTGCTGNATRLSLWFDAPDGQWREFGFSIWNDGDTVASKLYLIYPYEPGEEVDLGESVTGNFENDEFNGSFGWNYVDRGQVEFEYIAPDRVKGWFYLVMPCNVPRDPEVEDIIISGTFDTPYTVTTR